MNSVLSSLREALLSRGFRVVQGRFAVRIIYGDGSSDGFHYHVRFDSSLSLDTTASMYRVIRYIALKEMSPAAWIRGKGPYILKKVMLMSLLAAAEEVPICPVFELDLRRPADDMLAIVSGSPDFMIEYLSEGSSDTTFGRIPGAIPYRRRVSPKISVACNGGVRD